MVVLNQGETATTEEIMEHCRTRMSSFKRPRSVVFVDDLPRNPMGKVLKGCYASNMKKTKHTSKEKAVDFTARLGYTGFII